VGRLDRRQLLLGVTGSIAAYKACEVLRLLKKEGADVRVVMTEAATRFVHPLTFETLSGYEVVREMFPEHGLVMTRHVSLAEWAHCLLICPATANSIGKFASGIADDFLSTAVMASRSPVILAPAMDELMLRNPVYVQNCEKLRSIGYRFVEPETGELASGLIGKGRLASIERIVAGVKRELCRTDLSKGRRVLVTAGPTREFLDPVRVITNRSSGKMGFAFAEEAWLRGADVTLVAGPTVLPVPEGPRLVRVETARQMADAVHSEWPNHDILIMAAAVSDYRPERVLDQKLKKTEAALVLRMERTEDILAEAARTKGNRIVVGFALETEAGDDRALQKLDEKRMDLVCLNSPLDPDSGFETETTKITLFDRGHTKTELSLVSKREAARLIWDRIETIRPL